MAQEVSRRPFPEETVVRSRASSREICGGQSGTGTGFAPSMYFGFPPSVAFKRLYIIIFMLMLLLQEGQGGEAWQPSNKAMLFQIFECCFKYSRALDRKVLSHCLCFNGQLKKY